MPRMKALSPALLAGCVLALCSPMAAWTDNAPKLRDIPGIEKMIVVTATPAAPKHGEQTVIRLKDGRLLLLWSEFLREDLMPAAERPPASPLRRNPTGDDGYARISGMISDNNGRSWSKPWVVVDDKDALVNCISPGLTRMADGRLLLAYSWRSGGNAAQNYGNCMKVVRISSDEGATWSERIRITPDNTEYHTGCHDRSYTLTSGRVIVQCHTIFPPKQNYHGDALASMGTYFAYSDDHGQSWQRTAVQTDPLRGRFEEASLVERLDGSLLQVIRSRNGQSFYSESTDDGSTWTTPRPSGVVTSLAPTLIKRMPNSSDLLLIWNPNFNPDDRLLGKRSRLLFAISKDGGQTWGLPKALETDDNFHFEYPSVTFDRDSALIHYRVFPADRSRCDLAQARVPVTWFYDNTK